MTTDSIDLKARYGADAVTELATAYEAVLLFVSQGSRGRTPSRDMRLAAVEAMVAEGERGGFDALRLIPVGTSAATNL